MKKIRQLIIATILILSSFVVFTSLKYDLNIIEYIKYMMPFSDEERAYMSEKSGIKYGIDTNAPPLSFINNKTGIGEGLIVDYMSSISIETGTTIIGEASGWDSNIEKLKNRKLDTVDMFPSDEREEYFNFTQSIYSLEGCIAVADPNILKKEDLIGKKIAVVKGDYTEELFNIENNADKNKQISLVEVEGIRQGLEMMEQGEVDGVAGDETVIDFLMKKNETWSEFIILPEKIYQKNVTLAVNKDDIILLNILNKAILRLKKKDVLVRAQEKWFGISSPIIRQMAKYNLAFGFFVLVVLTIMLATFWKSLMNKRIAEKTSELEVNKRNLRTIIDSLTSYLILVGEDKKIIECNEAVEKLLCRKSEEIVGTKLGENDTIVNEIYRSVYPNQKKQIAVDGKYFDIRKVKMESEPVELLIFDDVTQTVMYETQLRQESKMKAVNHLSVGLAHEIRNPLGIIRNYLYILKEKVIDNDGIAAVDAANMYVDRINRLITNLLNFSKIGSEEPYEVNLNEMLTSIVDLEKKRLQQNQISLVINSHRDNTYVFSKTESLKIILFNIIDNAIEALSDIKRENEKRIEIKLSQNENKTDILISDNGVGMDEELVGTIFNPFFTTRDTGIGMGLYLVQNELDKIGGSVTVESSLDNGSTFHVVLPRTESTGGKVNE